MADPVAPYAATLDGVQAHLPRTRIGPDTHPSEANVLAYLAQLSASVRVRLGDITARADAGEVIAAARAVVEVGAASMAEAAAFPERADNADTSYAGTLWSQHRQMLDDLVTFILDVDGDGTPDGGRTPSAAGHFPDPLIVRDIGF